MTKIDFRYIGIIHSPYQSAHGTPIQPISGKDTEGSVEIFPEYVDGLKDLEGFSHIILIYYFHKAGKYASEVKPYMDDKMHGVFATRAPARPNPIGISVVRLLGIEKNIVRIAGLDAIDGTPVLDIKPYVPEFDHREDIEIGWLKDKIQKLDKTSDDGRFSK